MISCSELSVIVLDSSFRGKDVDEMKERVGFIRE